MKKIFTILSIFSFGFLFSQTPSLQAWTMNAGMTFTDQALSNTSVTVVSFTTAASNATFTSTKQVPVKYQNISSTTNTYSVIRTDVQINPGAHAYFCFGDIGSCFPTTVMEPTPTDYSVLGPGAATSPGIHLMTDLEEAFTVGYSEVRYKLFNVATGKTGADTLTFVIKYNQLLSVNEIGSVIESISDMFPNPANNSASVFVNLKAINSVYVSVFNSLGALISKNNFNNMVVGKNKISIDCSDLTSGLYFVQLTSGDSKITKRLIINK